MAEQKGIDGVVKIDVTGGTPAIILNVTTFSLEETSETLDVTSMSSTGNAREILPTFTAFSGTLDGYWDNTDAKLNHSSGAEPVIQAGTTIDFELYPEGEGTGNLYYNGTAIITSVSRSASFDGAVEYSIAFEGTGPLSYSEDT